MKTCWLWCYYYKWKFHAYIIHWRPLAPIVEHYSQEHLLLQRRIFTVHCRDTNTCQNTPKPYLSLSLAKILAPKSILYDLWGSIYNNGWGDPWHSPLWLFDFPHDSSTSSLNDTLHNMMTFHIPLMTLGISLTTYLQIILYFHIYPYKIK